MSNKRRAVAAYLTRAIVEHRAELAAEDLQVDELPDDDLCRVLWSVLDRVGRSPDR